MGRRRFDRAFKLEAVKLVRERGVSAAQAARHSTIGYLSPVEFEKQARLA